MSTIAAVKRLFCSKVVLQTFLAGFFCVALEWTGIQSATTFTPDILRSAGITSSLNQLLGSFGISAWQVLTVIPIIFLVDRFGRKSI